MEPFIKVNKKDLSQSQTLYNEISSLSSIVKESEESFLFCPYPGKIENVTSRLNHAKISFNLVSLSNLVKE